MRCHAFVEASLPCVPMTVRTGDVSVEQLTLGFVNVTDTSATLTISWEKTVATVDLKLVAGTR